MISQLRAVDTELNSEGEGPSRGLLRDYESSDGPSFQALLHTPELTPPPSATAQLEDWDFASAEVR